MGQIWDPKNPIAPFTHEGSLQHYPEAQPEWRDVRPWPATLTLVDYTRGRSAAYFLLEDSKGRRFPMMLADFTQLVMSGRSVEGAFTGWWTIRKRGQNYGIAAIEGPSA